MTQSKKAEEGSQQLAIVRAAEANLELQQPSSTSPSGYQITLVPVPDSLTFTPLQAAVILKSQQGFQDASLPYLLYTLAFCARAGLDPLRDIYRTGGRIAVYDEVKIRNLRSQPTLEWVKVSDPQRAENPISGEQDIFVVATAKDSRWDQPESYTAWYSEWATKAGASTFWTQAPIDSLQRKALARLAHRMYPLFGEQEQPSSTVTDTGQQLANAFKTAQDKQNDSDTVTIEPPATSNTTEGENT